MPWLRTEPMDDRMAFIAAWRKRELTMAELCRRHGISRKTGYKWTERYAAEGVDGLKERSRAPHHHPHQVAPAIAAAALGVRRVHPRWGPRKVLAWLEVRRPEVAWPVASTLGELFDAAGLTVPRRRRERVPARTAPFAGCSGPNAVWTADFKGWFRTGDGARCEPFTLLDTWSRYLLRCQAVRRIDTATVQAILEAACADAYDWILTKYDTGNPAALKRLLANGVKLLPFSNEIMAACYKTSGEVYDEIATKNAKFRKVYEPWKKFRDEQVQWFSIAENRYDNFMVAAQRSSQRVPTKK